MRVTLSSVWAGLPGADLKSSEQLTVASVRQHEGVAWSVGAGEAVLPGQEITLTISSLVSQPHFSDVILTYNGGAASRYPGRGQRLCCFRSLGCAAPPPAAEAAAPCGER